MPLLLIVRAITMAKHVSLLPSLLIVFSVCTAASQPFSGRYHEDLRKLHAFKSALSHKPSAHGHLQATYAPYTWEVSNQEKLRQNVYDVTSFGADPTGKNDSTAAILQAIAEAARGPGDGFLMEGISNLGGAIIHLQGGNYLISKPLRFPVSGIGNLVILGGTLRASDQFPLHQYLIDMTYPPSPSNSFAAAPPYSYEFITLRDLMLDCNYRGGGISVVQSLRTSIDNCYIAHFSTNGIFVEGGHETFIRDSFIGQHVTAGGDPGERNFTGTGIVLAGNDNAITDTVIFSAATGVMISGAANTLQLPGFTQTRIVNCYMDYTGIVAEDPAQLIISNSFFLGDAFVLLKSISGNLSGVTIVDNMFSGSNSGVDIVQLDQSKTPFQRISQVVVERNNARGMNLRTTIASGTADGNGTSWSLDFGQQLLFPLRQTSPSQPPCSPPSTKSRNVGINFSIP